MATVWLILTTLFVILLLYIFIQLMKVIRKFKQNRNALKNVSQLPRHWLFGNILDIQSWTDFLLRMEELFLNKGEKMYCFWLFHVPVVMVAHPDTARDILKSSEPKNTGIGGFGAILPWIGDGLVVSSGAKWERNRKLLTPAFHFDVLKPYVKIFNQITEVLMDKMEKNGKDEKSFEIFSIELLAALDSLLQCTLSYKGNIQQMGDHHPYVTAVKKLSKLMLLRTATPHHYPDCIYRLTANGREFYKHCKYVHEFSTNIITERRKILNENPDVLKKRHLDFLDILLTAKDNDDKGLTDEEIRSEVDTFMVAGLDTTATVLCWCLYALGKYPEQQTKVYKEVREAIGDRETVEWDDIAKLKYLSCFLKEVMRMYTPVGASTRVLSRPVTIEGVTIPEGTLTNIGFCHIHHHPDVWQNPKEFKPERFESQDILNKDPFSFVPFSAGPRNCIGQNFAQNEEKVMIARIIKRFEISVDPDHKVEPVNEIVLTAKNGIYVTVKHRKEKQS